MFIVPTPADSPPTVASSSAEPPHCVGECPIFGKLGFEECKKEHHNNKPCHWECFFRASEDAKCIRAMDAYLLVHEKWIEAAGAATKAQREGHEALATGTGLREALATVLEAPQRQKVAWTMAQEGDDKLREARHYRYVRRLCNRLMKADEKNPAAENAKEEEATTKEAAKEEAATEEAAETENA